MPAPLTTFTSLSPETQLIIAIVFIVLGFFLLLYIVDRIIDYIKHRQIMKHPEYLKMKAEAEALKQKMKFIPPTLIPKKVKVLVLREDQILEDICKYDGDVVRCKKIKMQFTVPENYKPYISVIQGRKLAVTLMFNDRGEAIKVNPLENSTKAFVPDPRITESIFGSRTLEQIMRKTFYGLDIGSLIAGVGLGVFAVMMIIFFILPILGYPVTIGKIPVEVKISQISQSSSLPPPGNYTLPHVPR